MYIHVYLQMFQTIYPKKAETIETILYKLKVLLKTATKEFHDSSLL